MGLFSLVIHLYQAPASPLDALDSELCAAGFERAATAELPQGGPAELPESEGWGYSEPWYLVSWKPEHWSTLIEGCGSTAGAPFVSNLSAALGRRLSCYSLCLVVHDDDVFLYNLDHGDDPLDGYNSCPQYFETEPLSKEQIERDRHSPGAFSVLLPDPSTLPELEEVLNRGYWHAYSHGELDADGVPPDFGFVTEAERMERFGMLLEIAGPSKPYPYSAWAENPEIDWADFSVVYYAKV